MKVLAITAFALIAAIVGAAPKHTFTWANGQFLLDGKPFQIRAGEMHFSRVPREYWHDRLRKLRAMGLNTVGTYMFWNVHEPEEGKFNFSGNADVAAFVRAAQEEGLWVLLRPGPYACAEWEWGGYPYWLANIPQLKVRSNDPRFLDAVHCYLREVGKQLAGLQIGHGGPILLTQVENEYGSYGSDKLYLGDIRDALRRSGFDGQLYSVDGAWALKGGTLPDVLPAVNFGDNPEGAFKDLQAFRPNVPNMNGEYYPGWFDQWGNPHSVTPLDRSVKDIEWMMERGASFSLYMVHGGWTPGFMNGANVDDGHYHPQTPSYYDDTCLDVSGRPTEKYRALREVILRHLPQGETTPAPPIDAPAIILPPIELNESAALFDHLPRPVKSDRPLSFEELHQAYGFVLYRTRLVRAFSGPLVLEGLQDRATVYADGRLSGVIDRRMGSVPLRVDLPAGATLDVLVENLGRVNYGKEILGERKGFSQARLGSLDLNGWRIYKLPMSSVKAIRYGSKPANGPSYFRGSFDVATLGDAFLDMRGWNKGVVWVNGHNLGRYWRIGAQQTIYVPGCWLKKRSNELVVFELDPTGQTAVPTVDHMIWDTPEEKH